MTKVASFQSYNFATMAENCDISLETFRKDVFLYITPDVVHCASQSTAGTQLSVRKCNGRVMRLQIYNKCNE